MMGKLGRNRELEHKGKKRWDVEREKSEMGEEKRKKKRRI